MSLIVRDIQDVQNFLLVKRFCRENPYPKNLEMEAAGVRDIIFGALTGPSKIISSYILNPLQDKHNKHLAAITVKECIRRNYFPLLELREAYKKNTLLEKVFSKAANFFGKVAEVSAKITLFIMLYAIGFNSLRFLERYFTGQDRWAELDQATEDQMLMSQTTTNFIFFVLPPLAAVISWGCSRLLKNFSAASIQARLTDCLYRRIQESTKPDRTNLARLQLLRDKELIRFLFEMNPPPASLV